jgi:hypothetical protein
MNEIHELVIEARIDGRPFGEPMPSRGRIDNRHAQREKAQMIDDIVREVMQRLGESSNEKGRSW